MNQNLSPKTLNDYLEAARRLLNWMEKHGRLVGNPLKSVEKATTQGRQSRERRAFTDDEVNWLLKAVPQERRTIYLVAVTTGLRHAEIGALRWHDVQVEGSAPFVKVRASTTKNGQSAVLPLAGSAVQELRKLKAMSPESEMAFARMPRIERFRRDLKLAGIEYKTADGYADFHALRVTFCTVLARAGVPRRIAMSLMRHSDSRLTDKLYTDEKGLDIRAAVEVLPSYGVGLSQGVSQNLDA